MKYSQMPTTPDKLLDDLNSVDKNNKLFLSQTLKSNIKQALVEKFLKGDERPCENSDFSETKENREKQISDIKRTIVDSLKDYTSCQENERKNFFLENDNELLSLILILCGQNVTLQPWNTGETVKNCETILAKILEFFNFKDLPELISRNGKINLIKDVLQILCIDLTASEWKHFPASVACYSWFLQIIEEPELSKHLQYVLPPALLLTDDFVKENTIIGVQCLNHIAQNITILELQLCGYGDVMYSALTPLLRLKDADIVHVTIKALVSVISKLEYDLGKKDPTKWSKCDTVLEIFLESMELEQRIDLRNCYISNLSCIISITGFDIIRWSKRLLKIFDEYIKTAAQYNDEKSISNCLKAVETYIELSREVSSLHAKQLFSTLCVALYFTSSRDGENNQIQSKNKELTIRCISILMESLSETEREELEKDFQKTFSSEVYFCKFYKQVKDIFLNKIRLF